MATNILQKLSITTYILACKVSGELITSEAQEFNLFDEEDSIGLSWDQFESIGTHDLKQIFQHQDQQQAH